MPSYQLKSQQAERQNQNFFWRLLVSLRTRVNFLCKRSYDLSILSLAAPTRLKSAGSVTTLRQPTKMLVS